MTRQRNNKIFARCVGSDFIGRAAELERLLTRARGENGSNGLVLLAAPSSGTSELLRQAYDRLFLEGGEVIPFYFEIKTSDGTLRNMALRFVSEFLVQTVAFRRQDTKILDSSPEMREIAELAIPSDGYWIDRLIETLNADNKPGDGRSFVRNCLSSPLRATGPGAGSFVMIDGLHIAAKMPGGEMFIDDLIEIFGRGSVPFVFAGLRRFLFAKTPFESMSLDHLSFADAGMSVENFAAKTNVPINDQTRDLIAVQMGCNARHIASLFASAAEKGVGLDSFERVQKVYTDETFGGRIGRYFDAIFDRICPGSELQARVLGLLDESLGFADGRIPHAYWKKHAGLVGAELETILTQLNYEEIVNLQSGSIRFDAVETVLGDYVAGRVRLASNGETRALVVGETLAANIRRAPALMARLYRQDSAIGLRKLMAAFDGRPVSPAMLDYGRFKDELKGADDEKIQKAFAEDNKKTSLPQIVYAAHTAAFYPKLSELADAERSAVALGFDAGTQRQEIVWIAVQIESKLEATRDVVEFWCDRLEMVGAHCNFARVQLWLVAPEGFAPDAIEALRERNAYGSSRKQAEMLAELLDAGVSPIAESTADEYEIVVPMGEDTEMISAHTIEDIAKRHGIPAKTINQIKTALIEACINAAEHSLSPDRKIYQKFAVDDEKIVITVANRGVRLADQIIPDTAAETGRRGWGLNLIKGLMDDVKIDETDDGTSITMTKFLKVTK